MGNYDSRDLDWSWDGDFIIGEDGDFKDNSDDLIRSLETELRTVIRSEFTDWEKHPMLGCNLSDFRGEPNTREVAANMEQRIISGLISSGIVRQGDVSIRIIPTAQSEVMIMLAVTAVATSGNRLELGSELVTTFLYDSLEDTVISLPINQLERESR